MSEAMVINRLLKWAKWKLNSGIKLGYPSQASFMNDTLPSDYRPTIGVNIEQEFTNFAIEKHLPEIYKLVLRIEYLSPVKTENLRARLYGKSRRTYRQDRKTAYDMLGNILDALRDTLGAPSNVKGAGSSLPNQ